MNEIRTIAAILETLADLTPAQRTKVLSAVSAVQQMLDTPPSGAVPVEPVDPEFASYLEVLPPQKLDVLMAQEEASRRWRERFGMPGLGLDDAAVDEASPSE